MTPKDIDRLALVAKEIYHTPQGDMTDHECWVRVVKAVLKSRDAKWRTVRRGHWTDTGSFLERGSDYDREGDIPARVQVKVRRRG